MRRFTLNTLAVIAAALGLVIAGCGGDDNGGGDGGGKVSGNLSMSGVWTGQEARSFQAVLDGFTKDNPDVHIKYRPVGDEIPTVLSTSVTGGNPPDLAAVPQPGLVRDFVKRDALKPIDFAKDTIDENFSAGARDVGTVNGKVYGLFFKAANKSTVWYNVPLFEQAGVEPPKDFDAFLKAAKTVKASGTPAYSLGASDGWTLTDLFENIYLRQAGPDKYDQLAQHKIPWTDPSVKTALKSMAQVLGDTSNIKGGKSGALQTDFPTSVSNVFVNPAKGAQVIEGDFVPGVVAGKTKLKAQSGYDVFPFPAIGDAANDVVGGGDSIVMFKDNPASRALITYLASPEAAQIWVKRGGFSSPNKNVPEDAYPDEITKTTATAIAGADTFRFDMSDLAPASFGGTPGQGEWKILQDFLSNPKDVDGTASKLEQAAAKAYK